MTDPPELRFRSDKTLDQALGQVFLDEWLGRGWLGRVLGFPNAVKWSRDTSGYIEIPELVLRCVPGSRWLFP